MYSNLEAEMARKGINKLFIAEQMGMRYATLVDKLNGKYPLSFDQAYAIKKRFFPEYSLEYLFSSDHQQSHTPIGGEDGIESKTASHK